MRPRLHVAIPRLWLLGWVARRPVTLLGFFVLGPRFPLCAGDHVPISLTADLRWTGLWRWLGLSQACQAASRGRTQAAPGVHGTLLRPFSLTHCIQGAHHCDASPALALHGGSLV